MSERRSKYAGLREASADTEIRTYGSTEVSEEASKAASEEISTEVSAAASADLPTETRKDVLASVREAISKQRKYEGGVKLTLDLRPELNTRAKRYLLDIPGATMRALLIELLEAFLDAEES